MTERVVETREESSDLEIEENWKDWRAESGGPTRGVSSRVEESTIWKRRARFGGEISRGKRCAWERVFFFWPVRRDGNGNNDFYFTSLSSITLQLVYFVGR